VNANDLDYEQEILADQFAPDSVVLLNAKTGSGISVLVEKIRKGGGFG